MMAGCYIVTWLTRAWQCSIHHTRTREQDPMSSKPDYSKSPYRPPFIGRAQEDPIVLPVPLPRREPEPVQDQPQAA
jgi:hypothetical protein